MMPRTYHILLLALITLLPGCGFHLRGYAELPPTVSPLYIEGLSAHDPLRAALHQVLTDAGAQLAANRAQARSILRLRNPEQERRVLSVDGSGKVVEYELHQALEFELIGADDNILATPQTIGTQRTYINTEDEVLGKSEEEADIRADMHRDLASRIVSRLQMQLR